MILCNHMDICHMVDFWLLQVYDISCVEMVLSCIEGK